MAYHLHTSEQSQLQWLGFVVRDGMVEVITVNRRPFSWGRGEKHILNPSTFDVPVLEVCIHIWHFSSAPTYMGLNPGNEG
jgi:hypothetical protein